jgi:putative ABC transport system permease protein
VLGLAVGLACVVLIALWVGDELRYDRFHTKADRIVRIAFDGQIPNAPPDQFAVSSPPVAEAIQAFPEVEAVTRLEPWNPVLRVDGRYASGDTYYAVDPGFLDVFTFPLVAGDAATALNAPNTLVVTSVLTREGLRTTGPTAATAHPDSDLLRVESMWPNPARAEGHISFVLASAAVEVVVYDGLGRRVSVLLDKAVEAGTHRARIDASALPAGVYLVRVTAQTAGGAVTATVPLTIIR